MMTVRESLETILLTNFGILTVDVAYNKRFKNNLDPVFILFVMYLGLFTNKFNKLLIKDSINL